ncbi:MAG: putative ATPase (AAA+ superfamily) [uncultured Acidilobus sp. JCHS]|jgi:Predicted ATPase (AAA+ superfamily)|nr:MAG: putative ATPase (AAA+ superfamily) [uncultured Acidilobus sp. JCHS]
MLFDERPKERREDLFDREAELAAIMDNINRPLLVLSGVRRIGKTSLLLVALNELGRDYILIDARELKANYGRRDLYSLLSKALSSRLSRLADVLRGIRGINIMSNYVEISWRGRDYISLAELFDALNRRRLIVAIDEAQRLRGPMGAELREALAHAYDYDRNLTFVLTGSEVGLLHELIGVDDPSSPLYGRYYHEVQLGRFSEEQSAEFLRRGFEEAGLKVGEEVIDEMVRLFDGIPGWLTFAGNQYLAARSLEEVRERAIGVALRELENLVEEKSRASPSAGRRYRLALKCIAEGRDSWSSLRRCVEEGEGVTLSSSVLDNVLRTLERLSIVKDYEFLDPVYREAARRLR